jgi:hypothetical protein
MDDDVGFLPPMGRAIVKLEPELVEDQRKTHGVHTLILYGSHARGDATPESDIDVAGFADVATTLRDARLWNGVFLDAFVYPTPTCSSSAARAFCTTSGSSPARSSNASTHSSAKDLCR